MANRIQLRRDTQANWNRVNPILEDGEPGLDITTNQIKYGDGSSTWTELAYASGGSGGSISFDYSTVQEGDAGPGNVTSITGNPGTGVSLTSDEWAQLMWVPNTANVTVDNIGTGGAVYNWAYVDNSGFIVKNETDLDEYEWKFGNTGVTTFPGNTLTISHGMGDGIVSTDSMTIGASGGIMLTSAVDSANLSQINLDGFGNIQIRSIYNNATDYRWDFNSDGTLTLPVNSSIQTVGNTASAMLQWVPTAGNLSTTTAVIVSSNGVSILTDAPSNENEWVFGTDGTMTFPNGNNNINKQRYGMGNLVAYLDGEWTLGEYNGTVYGNTGIRISPGIEGAVELTLPSNQTANVNPASFANYEGNVEIRSSNLTWKYDTAGNLSLPSDAKLIAGFPGYGYIANTAALAGDQVYLSSTDGNAWVGVENGAARIGHESTQKYWNFGADGTLTAPGNVTIGSGYGNISQIDTIFANNYAYANGVSILSGVGSTGNITFTDTTMYSVNDMVVRSEGNVYVDSLGGDYTWTFGVDGTTSFPDHKAVSITGNLTVGNLTVNGSTTTISTNSYVVSDNIVQFADGNPADTLDIGFVGHRTVNGTLQHTGLIRDASTGIWELFSNVTAQPGTTVDFTQALLDDLQLDKLYADTIHLTGTAPSTNLGDAGDLEGDIHVDDNYLYYCTQDWTASAWTVGWEGSTSNTLFITKGDYPTPQVGWIVDQGGSGPWTIDTVTDNGSNWQITWVGGNFGSPTGGTATLTNPNPAVIWKTVPLTAFQTSSTYGNTEVASYLPTYTGNIGGNISISGTLRINSANSAPFSVNDALYVVGGLTTGANISAGGRLVACSFATSTNINSGAIQTNGGIGAWGNIYAGQNVVATGNVSATYFIGDGSLLTNIASSGGSTYGDSNVASYLTTYSGNFTASSVVVTGNVTAANIITSGATSGNISGANYISANAVQVSTGIFWANGTAWSSGGGTTYSSTGAGNVTIVGSAINLTTSGPGATTVGSSTAIPIVTTDAYGRVSTMTTAAVVAPAGTLSGSTLTATVTASSLTSVGTLVSLAVTGNVSAANVAVTNTVTAANIVTTGTYGNITGANVISANTVTVTTCVRTQPVTFSALPSASGVGAGARAFITDGNTSTFGSQVSGSGANTVPVYSNGTNWYVG